MRVQAIKPDAMELVLHALTRANELAARVALQYGLRIGDVLRLTRKDVEKGQTTIKEEKTGKRRTIKWTKQLREQLLIECGKVYVFEHRTDYRRHRTRQTVYKDIKRAAKLLHVSGLVGTHSLRKSYAVRKYQACGDMRKVKALLCHSDEAVTMLYALAAECDWTRKKYAPFVPPIHE